MEPKDEIDIKLLLNYPLISKSVEDDSIVYKGIIEIDDEDYRICIKQTFPNDFILELPSNLQSLEEGFGDNAHQTHDIIMYLDSLKKYISSKIPSKKPQNHCETYRQVLYEFSEFSKFYLNLKSCYLAYDLSKVSVTTLDEQNREHYIEIRVDYGDKKNIFEIAEFDLPYEKDKFKKSSNLKVVFNQFVDVIETLQPFFSLMEDFDKNCNILDPVPQKKRYNYRRIWLGDTLSLIITIDPFSLGKMPNIIFLGPERMVEFYRSTMNQNLENWDPTNGIYIEILKLIGLDTFPKKSDDAEGKNDDLLLEAGDCSICFLLKLNDKLPEIVCRNKFCDNCYHTECLYEWLISVNSRRFFTEVVGACPNCEKNISCPIPN